MRCSQGGVPTVVAMRYAVGDEYARELGVEFYRALLALRKAAERGRGPDDGAGKSLRASRNKTRKSARYAVCDHATPVFYGAEQPGLTLRERAQAPASSTRNPRLHQIAELTTAGHEHFVGRTWELAGLGAEFIGSGEGARGKARRGHHRPGRDGQDGADRRGASPVGNSGSEWVLIYQAKPNALGFEATLRDIHLKLNEELGRYHEHMKANSRRCDLYGVRGGIHRPWSAGSPAPTYRALKAEPILLVLDNFEKCLKPQAEPSSKVGEPVWACQDPAWDHFLALLSTELAGSPSRVLITCRRPLAALAGRAGSPCCSGPCRRRSRALPA